MLAFLVSSKGKPLRTQISTVQCDDPDDLDREFSDLDTITITFSVHEYHIPEAIPGVGTTVPVWLPSTSTKRIDWGGKSTLNKEEIDSILRFFDSDGVPVSLGADYTAVPDTSDLIDRLKITVMNATGADTASLWGLGDFTSGFQVACAPGMLNLTSADIDDEACPSTEAVGPSKQSDWGKGRPLILSVTSGTPEPDRLLAAGDFINVTFDADVDTSTAGTDVTALFVLPTELGTSFSGAWDGKRTFVITLIAEPPTSEAPLPSGNDFQIACRAGGNLQLDLTALYDQSPSAKCCEEGMNQSTCPAVHASGSFGAPLDARAPLGACRSPPRSPPRPPSRLRSLPPLHSPFASHAPSRR